MPNAPSAPLAAYDRKRDFSRTAEPRGDRATTTENLFVVQMHDATRLHYDFRLELDGVLLSWAVTRGPSLDPAQKRLAVRVEDHPVSYGEFEGTIPEGSYGAGTVMLWDRGIWTPEGDPHAGLKAGKLRFALQGERLRGDWMLIRMRGGKRGDDTRENWLLRKLDDAEAGAADTLTDTHRTSIKTGRSLEDIAGKAARKDRASSSRTRSAPFWKVGVRTDTKPASTDRNKRADEHRSASRASAKNTGAKNALVYHGIRISSPDRAQYPQAGIRKRDLAAYYRRVAEAMLLHWQGRLLTLIRCPRGAEERCFVQQHSASRFPEAVRTLSLRENSGKRAEHVFVEAIAGVLACVQMGVLEFHGWGARAGAIGKPDRLVLDLDPHPSLPFAEVVDAARLIRDRLREDGIASWPMLSGGKGVHIIPPLEGADWRRLSAYAKRLAQALERDAPERFTADSAKADREGRIYVDYLRNQRGATAILPFSTRAKPSASVAMPLTWEALDAVDSPQAFTVRGVLDEGLPEACPPQRLPGRHGGQR